jgi:hypothetical protein
VRRKRDPFLALMEAYLSEIHPALKRALTRAQAVPLPREVLDKLMAADAKIHQGLEPANAAVAATGAAGMGKAQIPRRGIATLEHLSDEARALTRRIDRLIEESGSRSV